MLLACWFFGLVHAGAAEGPLRYDLLIVIERNSSPGWIWLLGKGFAHPQGQPLATSFPNRLFLSKYIRSNHWVVLFVVVLHLLVFCALLSLLYLMTRPVTWYLVPGIFYVRLYLKEERNSLDCLFFGFFCFARCRSP